MSDISSLRSRGRRDPADAPTSIATEGEGDSKGKVSRGIYKLDGDKLVVCMTHLGVDNRPAEFKPVENEAFLFDLRKQN